MAVVDGVLDGVEEDVVGFVDEWVWVGDVVECRGIGTASGPGRPAAAAEGITAAAIAIAVAPTAVPAIALYARRDRRDEPARSAAAELNPNTVSPNLTTHVPATG